MSELRTSLFQRFKFLLPTCTSNKSAAPFQSEEGLFEPGCPTLPIQVIQGLQALIMFDLATWDNMRHAAVAVCKDRGRAWSSWCCCCSSWAKVKLHTTLVMRSANNCAMRCHAMPIGKAFCVVLADAWAPRLWPGSERGIAVATFTCSDWVTLRVQRCATMYLQRLTTCTFEFQSSTKSALTIPIRPWPIGPMALLCLQTVVLSVITIEGCSTKMQVCQEWKSTRHDTKSCTCQLGHGGRQPLLRPECGQI